LSAPLSKEFYDNFRKKQFDAYGDCANVSNFDEYFSYFYLPEESKLMKEFDAAESSNFKKEYRCQEIGEVLKENENLVSAQDGPGQNQGFIGRRIDPPIDRNRPDINNLTNSSIVKLAYGYE
jgi:hypothetical protein